MDNGDQKTWTRPDGRTVRLRPMEARVLAYLRLHQGQIVSMKELLRNVWGYNTAARSRTVYTTINRLRLAIEADVHRPELIVTVPGGGFRWAGPGSTTVTRGRVRALPHQLDTFVERPEVASAAALLRAGQRLVTLTGIGGIGKTRAALEIARQVETTFGGGAELVDLASCADAESMCACIGRDLGLDMSSTAPEDTIARAVAARAGAVIVLDNVEGVVRDLAPVLRDALREPWGASLLVTSRGSLGVRGENVVPIGPLSLLRQVGAATSPAGDLFVDRMGAPGLQLDPDDVEAVVTALGGMPLAIEFAAARARAIPLGSLRVQLTAESGYLRRPPGSDARHASVESAIEESWNGLDGFVRDAMTCLTILGGSFSFALAGAVLPSERPASDTLQRLVAAGMLQFDGTSYRMLVPVAEFIRKRAPASDRVWERLDDFLSALPMVDIWDRRASERHRLDAVAHLLPDAWVRAWNRGSARTARALLFRTYASREWQGGEGCETSALADRVIATAGPGERARIHLERANFYPRETLRQIGQAIEWAQAARDPDVEAYARTYRGALDGYRDAADVEGLEPRESAAPALRVVLMTRRYHQAVGASLSPAERLSTIEAAVALSNAVLEPDLELHKDLLLAHVQALEHCGHYQRALCVIEELERWLARWSDLGSAFSGAAYRVTIRCAAGRLDDAERLVARLMGLARQSGSPYLMARSLACAAHVSAERGEIETALVLWREAAREFAQFGSRADRLHVVRDLARTELYAERVEQARATLSDAAFAWPAPFVAFWRDLMLLRCDLSEAFDSVDEARVLGLVARASTRGASALAWALGLHAWWLAGSGDAARADAALGQAWAALGPAQGLQSHEIARIERAVRAIRPAVPRPTPRDVPESRSPR